MIRSEKQVPLDKFFDFLINIRVKSFVDSWFNFCQVRPVNKRFDPFILPDPQAGYLFIGPRLYQKVVDASTKRAGREVSSGLVFPDRPC